MPLSIERRVRELDADERRRIARFVDLLAQDLRPANRPRRSFSGFVLSFAISFVFCLILGLFTFFASNAPALLISIFWLVITAIFTVWTWLSDYRKKRRFFRLKQLRFDRISDILHQVTLTAVHLRENEVDDGHDELQDLIELKSGGFRPQVGDDLVVFENDECPEILIVDSRGCFMVEVPQ